MSAANSSDTSQGVQDTKSPHEQDKLTSGKLPQVVIFLRKTEAAIEQYLNKKHSSDDDEELQSTVKNLAIVLKSGDEDQSEYLLELMKEGDDKMMKLLSELAFQLFKSSVLQGVSLSPHHPLILTYYCIDLAGLIEKCVECGIIQLAIQHLKKLEMFITLTGELLTLAKLLMSFLVSCFESQAAVTVMIHHQLHQSLAYYIQMFEFNTAIMAKSALAILSDKISGHFLHLVKLSDKDLSDVQQILTIAVETKSLNVRLIDRQASSDYYINGFLELLKHLTINPYNSQVLGSSLFINIYHSILLEPALRGALKNLLLLVKSICKCSDNAVSIQKDHGEFLATLEQLNVGEELQTAVIEVIWSIMNTDDTMVNSSSTAGDKEEEELADVLKALMIGSAHFFLRNRMAEHIIKMNFYELKVQFSEILCILRYLMALNEHLDVSVITEKCHDEICSVLKILCDYSMWMICREEHLKESTWSLMHPLVLFHVVFYFIANMSDDGRVQLRDSGVLDVLVKELQILQLIPAWHKGIHCLAQLILLILLKCSKVILPGLIHPGVMAQFCAHEDFLYRISSKSLLAGFSSNSKLNLKLTQLLESEATNLLTLFCSSSKNPKKVFRLTTEIKSTLALHVCFSDIAFMISVLLQCNPANQKILHMCSTKMSMDNVVRSAHHSMQAEVAAIISMITGERVAQISNQLSVASLMENSTSTQSPEETEGYNQVQYWMCCVINSIREVVSPDPVDDNLTEHYCLFDEDSLYQVGLNDLLFSDFTQLAECSSTEQGAKAFHTLLLQMPQFIVLLKSFLLLSFTRIQENNDQLNIPATSMLRLERIFLLIDDHCQKSSVFCDILAHSGIITRMVDGLFVLYACQSYTTIDVEWILLRLAEPILYILAVCATNGHLQGYFRICPELLRWCCRMKFGRCAALAKINLSILSQYWPTLADEFELTESEANFIFDLLSSAIYGQENEHAMWMAYTTDVRHSVKYFLLFCLHLISIPSNADKLFKAGILGCISYLFYNCKETSLVKTALQLLLQLTTFPNVLSDIKDNHATTIITLQAFLQEAPLQQDAFYCLHSIGCEVPNITSVPDSHVEAVAMLKTERYTDCIQQLHQLPTDMLQSGLAKILGEAYYMLYVSTVKKDKTKAYDSAKQAVKYLGSAYDEQKFADEDTSSEHLDVAMMDYMYHIKNKPLSRCLLCRKKCGKGEKLIRSHIWPESLLRFLLHSDSQQVFDVTWKRVGNLQGPGQIYLTMLCKSCENLFSRYENAFKMLFVGKLYSGVDESSQQSHNISDDEIAISLLQAPGAPRDWLYRFCLSIVFRMFTLACQGDSSRFGNFSEWYKCFIEWRNILLEKIPADTKIFPKVALLISPVTVLKDLQLSPRIAKIIFSTGIGAFSNYCLHDGTSICSDKPELLLCSIGIINIVVSYDSECFKFIPSECVVIPGNTQFVIPSAIKRYLIFPKGIWTEYNHMATLLAARTYNMPTDKVTAPVNKTWAEREMAMFSSVLGETVHTERQVNMNFLPAPFDRIQNKILCLFDALKSSKSFQVVLHSPKLGDTEDLTVFILKNKEHKNYPTLFSILILESRGYVIWIAYKLSEDNLAIENVIQGSSTKAFLPQAEKEFRTKQKLQERHTEMISKVGFADVDQFLHWIKEVNCLTTCDMRCFPNCLYCLEMCNCCMGSTATSSAVPIYEDNFVQTATVCDLDCTRYVTSFDPLPVILHKAKKKDGAFLPALQAFTNGVLFGLVKVKVIVQYFTEASNNEMFIWCQFRSAFRQHIYKFMVDKNSLEPVTEPPANFTTIFNDGNGKDQFAKFLKDVWCYFQSLLGNPPVERQSVSTQESGKVDDDFEYYATMSVDPADVPPVLPTAD